MEDHRTWNAGYYSVCQSISGIVRYLVRAVADWGGEELLVREDLIGQ